MARGVKITPTPPTDKMFTRKIIKFEIRKTRFQISSKIYWWRFEVKMVMWGGCYFMQLNNYYNLARHRIISWAVRWRVVVTCDVTILIQWCDKVFVWQSYAIDAAAERTPYNNNIIYTVQYSDERQSITWSALYVVFFQQKNSFHVFPGTETDRDRCVSIKLAHANQTKYITRVRCIVFRKIDFFVFFFLFVCFVRFAFI